LDHWCVTIHDQVRYLGLLRVLGAIRQRDVESGIHSMTSASSFQIGTDDIDEVTGSLFCGLGFARHVISDVVFHKFGHQAVDGSTGGAQAL
jgi:hypothetical protein